MLVLHSEEEYEYSRVHAYVCLCVGTCVLIKYKCVQHCWGPEEGASKVISITKSCGNGSVGKVLKTEARGPKSLLFITHEKKIK